MHQWVKMKTRLPLSLESLCISVLGGFIVLMSGIASLLLSPVKTCCHCKPN